MATITCLSDEVIAIILGYNDLSFEDIVNFRCMWEQFPSTAKYDIGWERIFSKRWPSAKKVYDEQSKEYEQESEGNERKDKKKFIETGINCARQLRSYVSQIIHKHYYDNESIDNYNNKTIDNLMKFEEVFYLDKHLKIIFNEIISKSENFIKYSFFIDEIRNLLTQSPRRTGCDLTERYCYIKLFHYMRQCSVKEKWYRFKRQSDKNQLLERKATMVAQWFQPEKDVFYSCVKASLNSIAVEVRNCLREKHPDHSIFLTSDETFSHWESNNIDDNHWNEAEGMQIMDTLDECMFDKLNFRPSKSEDITNLEYMCIDNVLKNKYGQEIIILIIYHSVARRLGLRCDVIQPEFDRYCIYWKPIYATTSSENVRCFNISFKKFPDCLVNQSPFTLGFLRGKDLNRQLWQYKIFEDLVLQCKLRSMVIIKDYDLSTIKRMRCDENANRLKITSNGSIEQIEYDESNVLSLRAKNTEPLNTRPDDVKFAVGMIVTHDDQSPDSCVGVIVGWHIFQMDIISYRRNYTHAFSINIEPDNEPMHICDTLPLNHCHFRYYSHQKTNYVNYVILTENNKMCHVQQDAITLTTPKWIDNSEIGRYFCKFEDKYYVPNEMLARLYPHDAAITANTAISEN